MLFAIRMTERLSIVLVYDEINLGIGIKGDNLILLGYEICYNYNVLVYFLHPAEGIKRNEGVATF